MIDISSFISEDRYKIPQGVRDWDGSRITAPEVGFWDGTKDAIKDILPNAALHVGSALTGMFTGSGRQATIEQAAAEAQEQGIPITDPKEFARKQAEYMDASAKELRRIAEEEYTPNPEATGVAGQIIHGVGTELTKAVLVAPIAAASPQAAALAYGAMHGVETTQRYKDKGVDENTANWLGVSAFGTGTLGFLIPAAAGPTRLASAVYGAITNPAANVSEDLTARMILRKQNYEALAATINPFDPLNLAVAAFVGGGFGTIGFHKKATAAAKKTEEKPKEAAQEKPQTLADSVVEGAKTVKKAAAEVPDVSQVQEASTLRMAENGVVLQNRNRGTASSIVQMQQIAGNPIYNMVSVSREFSSGAPVIAFPNNISEGQWGRTEMVSASDGSQMEMRYAVVEADNLQVSNFADGTRNTDYGVVKQNVTIAGNGRVAGISAAYERGTAEKYKADLIKDVDNVGIKPSVIEGMKEPVLVRVMSDRDAGRPDIAMLSNQSGTKALDATEQAENDAAAIDVSKLTFDENGNITDETVKQFAALVPDNSSLVDRNGIPNTLARPRLERAIFQRAYGNANLTSLLTDTESEGGRAVSIFLKLAPKMMQLEGAGDLDFRDALVAALNEVYVARASDSFKSLKELAASQSLGRMPETQAFLDYLSGVGNQVNAPTQVFAQLADWSLANKLQAEGMFADESPLPTRADLMMEFQDLTGVPVDPYVLDMIKAQVTRAQAREKISTTIREKLAAAGQEAEQVEAQSRIWTNAVMHLAELAHRDPLEILPNIDLEGVPSSADGFTMPVTQGRNWQYGDHAAQNPDYRVKVARLSGEKEGVLDNKTAADILNDFVGETPKNRLKNDVTDWVFSISGNDKKEIIHGLSRTTKDDGPDVRADNVAILRNLPEVIKNAFPAESYRDIKAAQGVKSSDAHLKGLHRFYSPVVVNGKEYLVKITVKDRTGDGGKNSGLNRYDRLGAYQIIGIETEKAQPKVEPSLPVNVTGASPDAARRPIVEVMNTPRYTADEITVRDMLTGVKRDGDVVYKKETGADGKESWVKDEDKRSRFFVDEPNEWAYAEDGGYWRDPTDTTSDMEFYQTTGAFSYDASSQPTDRLVAVHHIDADNLLKANALGGLAVPSIGITKVNSGYSGFGDITLIGTKGLIDPATGTPVYSADAYTNTFPVFEWGKSVDKKKAEALRQEYRKTERFFRGGMDNTMRSLIDSPDRDDFMWRFRTSVVSQKMFLDEKGIKVEPVYQQPYAGTPLEHLLLPLFQKIEADQSLDVAGSMQAYNEAYVQAVDALGDKATRVQKRNADKIRNGGRLVDAYLYTLINNVEKIGKAPTEPQIDSYATEKRIREVFENNSEGFDAWVAKKTEGLFGEPKIKVGGKLVPVTLQNVVKAMTKRVAKNTQDTMTFGPGKVRAAASKKFSSVKSIQANRERVVDSATANEANKSIDAAMSDFRRRAADFYGYKDAFAAMDDAMRALADSAKGKPTTEKVRAALVKNGFKEPKGGFPSELLDSGVKILTDVQKGLTDYFEAKPQRAVGLSEFAGAVVPEGTLPEVLKVLEDAGVEVRTYAKDTVLPGGERTNNRLQAEKELSQKLQQDRGDVLFQHDRGESEIRGSFNPQTNTLRLTPNSDITTFSHEMGHFWLTNAIRLSTLPGSDLSLRRDVRKLMDTWGIKDASEWEKLGTEGQRQYHEQFASWVEEFLATGRVPNDSLRGFFEKMRQWITDLYRDIRSHLNSRYRQEFGKDLPALSDEVRDILERNIAYEDRLAAVQRDFSPTTAQTDAARYATFENVVKNDQLVDRSDAQSLQGSLFAEQQAKDALNNREKVNVNGPMDADMLQGRQDAVKKSLHMPESLEARPKDEGMPVHEITKAEPKPEVQEEGGIAAVVRRVSDALLGKQLEENAAPKEDADVADIMRRSDEVLEKSPDMQLTPDEVSDANDVKPGKTAAEYVAAVDAEAQSIEKFANVMSTAAMCVLRNGGITHA